MARVTTNFNVDPYYDDYDADKGFLRVLFRPGFAVQGRELTQLQTILQEQSSRLGEHFFKDGSPVIGGELTLDTEVQFLKLSSGTSVTEFQDNVIVSGTTKAIVLKAIEGLGSDLPTLIIKFINGTTFPASSTITIQGTSTTAIVASASHIGEASIVSVNRGIYFVNGFFVQCLPQTLVLEKYNNTPTYRVGLSIGESIINSDTDTSLLDPASGTTNANAPGATRFKIVLTLAKKEITSTDPVAANADSNFIELMRIVNGVPVRQTKYPIYSELEKTLARRTFDESGDYTVRPFPVRILDHQGASGVTAADNDTTINGVGTNFINDFEVGDRIYLSSDSTSFANVTAITNSTSLTISDALGDGTTQTIFNTNRVSAAVDPGKAYVKGYEYENISTEYVDVKKGRNTSIIQSFPVNPNFGNYVKVKNFSGGSEVVFDPQAFQTFDIHSVLTSNVVSTNANTYNSTKIGTARVRQLDYSSGTFETTSNAANAIFDLYIFDVQTTALSMNVGSTYTSGDPTIVLESDRGSSKDDAYNGAKITLGEETREITDYVGSSQTATLNLAFSSTADTANVVTLNFSSREIEALAIANTTSYALDGPKFDIDLSSKVDTSNATSNTRIFDTDLNSLLYDIGLENVQDLGGQGISYQRKASISASFTSDGTNTTATISAPEGVFETEGKTSGSLEAVKANYVAVITSITSDPNTSPDPILTVGEIIDLDILVSSPTQLTLTPVRTGITFGSGYEFTAKVYATLDSSSYSPKVKTLISANTTGIVGSSNDTNRLANGQIILSSFTGTQSLLVPDIYQISNIIEDDGTTFDSSLLTAAIGNTAHPNNITSKFSLYNGQRDCCIEHGSVTLKAGQTPSANNILVLFDYFQHSTADGYASVESYTNIEYADIPAFTSPVSGQTKQLRDCLDFRPIKAIGSGGDLQTNEHIPDADIQITANVSFFLPRKDKLTLAKDRVFKVITGIPSENPDLPADDDDAMTIYNLSIPAYTFNASDVDTQYIDNRRFTMRDIGKIEKRVDTLEYYTALSLLEKEATDLSIKDAATGTERFKNGILVDSFSGHNIGDVVNEDYVISIDPELQELRPSFNSDSFRFDYESTANTTKTGDLVTLAYSSANLVVQPLSSNSEFINPFGANQFNGTLDLSPASDVWFSESGRPLVLINLEGLSDHWVQGNDFGFGKQWNDWNSLWSGTLINDDTLLKKRSGSQATSNAVSRSASPISENRTRTGIVTTKAPESIKRTVGNKTISLSIVPYVRSQKIQFVAKGMQPLTTVYPFFDNTAITSYVKPAYALSFTANTSSANSGVFNTNPGEQVRVVQTNNNGADDVEVSGVALYQNSSTVLVSDIIQEVTWTQTPSLSVGETITFYSDSGKTTQTAIATLQSYDTSKNTFTINTVSGTIDTGYYISGSVTGTSIAGTVSDPGLFGTGQLSFGVGSSKANGNITAVGTTTPALSAALTTDTNGVVAGEFDIPANVFRTGERLLRLTDSETDTVANTVTVAEKVYRIQGLIDTKEGRNSSTRATEVKRENIKENQVTTDTINRISTSSNWINPLTQTFIVDRSENENGVFINSVDVFFSAVDSTLPVTLQIRPVVNGFPSSSSIVPFSEVTLNPSEISYSATAPDLSSSSTYTRFTFNSPVYLYPDEYAIVLTSPSVKYSVHVSDLGEIVRNTQSTKVSRQPNVGSFYSPQNSSVWQSNAIRQLMFRVNRCEFDTGTHVAYFPSQSVPLSGTTSGVNYDVFKLSTSQLTFSNTAIEFAYKGIPATSTVASESNRSSQIDSSFITFNANRNVNLSEQKKFVPAIDTTGPTDYSANNFYLRATFTSNDSKISPAIDMSRLNLITVENQINRGSIANSDIVVTNGGTGYSTAPTVTISGGGGTGATATAVLDGGSVSSVTVTSGGVGYYEAPTITFSSGAAEATIQNELASSGGNAKSRYITRRVTLQDGFDAQDLKVFLTAYKPKETDIKVYYRVHNQEDPELFEDKPYVLMTQQTDANLTSASEADIHEYAFKTPNDVITYTANGITYDKFKTFSIKIVLGSASTSIVPTIKDVKVIALDF